MNPGTFQGAGTGTAVGTISNYIQTPVITSSQTVAVPPGTRRIEALLCGGGGGGGGGSTGNNSRGGGGGFGGLAIMAIPITGKPLVVTVGAGGTATNPGSPTYITSGGTIYATVGGGGAGGGGSNADARNGRFGGCGGGGGQGSIGGDGGPSPLGTLIWSPNNSSGIQTPAWSFWNDTNSSYFQQTIRAMNSGTGAGFAGQGFYYSNTYGTNYVTAAAQYGNAGGGNGAALTYTIQSTTNYETPLFGAGAYTRYTNVNAGTAGAGGGGASGYTVNVAASAGGSLTSLSVWGLTGFAGGSAGNAGYSLNGGGGGGGGMLGAGTTVNGGTGGGAGGSGGGGGGGGSYDSANGEIYPGGTGGNGFAVIRFYL